MRRRYLLIAAAAFLVAVAAAVAIIVLAATRTSQPPSGSAGQIIFNTGRDPNGNLIARTSSSGGGMMGGAMMAGGCASCHGSDGHGRSTTAFTAPDITYANLTDPKGMLQPDGTRGPTYNEASLRRAITQGTDPKGDRLAWPMPQWQLTFSEWTDLLTYLKTLR
jgi:mono/diheme cytochrome c family protein